MRHYPHFILPMRSSRGFASAAWDFFALFGLAFASAPLQRSLASPPTASRRIIMQKAPHHTGFRRRALSACKRMVSGSLSSPLGVLLIFRSRYWFAIGRQGVLSLAGWAPQIQTHFHVSGPTQVPGRPLPLSPTGLSPPVVEHSRNGSASFRSRCAWSYNPTRRFPGGLGWSAFARAQLHRAFRSVPRPSSPPGAKTSPTRP
jgi:hypothetical protein